jgi:hypothetical protein
MKNLFIYISLLIAATTLAYSLAPVTVVLNNDGDNVTAKLNDYSSGSPVQVGGTAEYNIPTLTDNGSGYSSFVMGQGEEDWGNIPKSKVNSNVILDVYKAGTLIAQFRLDQLIEVSARTERLPSNVNISQELNVAGESTFQANSEFKGQVKVTGVLVQASNEFKTRNQLGEIESNIMIFTGKNDLTINDNHFSSNLVNGATYTIINKGGGQDFPSLTIELDNGYAYLSQNQAATIIKIGGKLFIVSQPANGG